jgi:hypothetical protein
MKIKEKTVEALLTNANKSKNFYSNGVQIFQN